MQVIRLGRELASRLCGCPMSTSSNMWVADRADHGDIERRPRVLEAELLHDFFESAAEGLRCVAADGTILWANGAELRLVGYPRDQYIGRRLREFFLDPSLCDDMLARIRRGESVSNLEARIHCSDGS